MSTDKTHLFLSIVCSLVLGTKLFQNMRNLLIFSLGFLLAPKITRADDCQSLCSLIPGACSSTKGSYCKNSYACMDLFWYSDNSVICNHESLGGCEGRREVLCSQARNIVRSRNSGGIVAFVNQPTTSTTAAPIPPSLSTLLARARRVTEVPVSEFEGAYDYEASNFQPSWFGGRWDVTYLGISPGDPNHLGPMFQQIFRSRGNERECMYLVEFLIDRPTWFYFSYSAVDTIRECLGTVVSQTCESLRRGPFYDAVARMIGLIYSPVTERVYRERTPSTVDFAATNSGGGNYTMFREFLVNISSLEVAGTAGTRVEAILKRAIEGATIPDTEWLHALSTSNRKYLNHLMESDFTHPGVRYLGEFLDNTMIPLYMANAVLRHVPAFDALEVEHIVSDLFPVEASVLWERATCLNPTPGGSRRRFGEWYPIRGEFFWSLWLANRDDVSKNRMYKSCLPSDIFGPRSDLESGTFETATDMVYIWYSLKANGNGLDVYRCFAEALFSEQLALPTDMSEPVLARHLLHLVRDITNGASFLMTTTTASLTE